MLIPSISSDAWTATTRNLRQEPLSAKHKRIFGECLTLGLEDGAIQGSAVQAAVEGTDIEELAALSGAAVRARLGGVPEPEWPGQALFGLLTDFPMPGQPEDQVAGIEYAPGFHHAFEVSLDALAGDDPNRVQDALLVVAVLDDIFPGMRTGRDAAEFACDMDESAQELAATALKQAETMDASVLDAVRADWEDSIDDLYGEPPDDEQFEYAKGLCISAHQDDSPLYRFLISTRSGETDLDAMFRSRRDRGGSDLDSLVERAESLWRAWGGMAELRGACHEAHSVHRDMPCCIGSGLLLIDADKPPGVISAIYAAADALFQMDMEAEENHDAALIPLFPGRWGESIDYLRLLHKAEDLLHDFAAAIPKIDTLE